MTDRSNWPEQVTPQHAAWVNRKLAERGEPRHYSETTGRQLRYGKRMRRIQLRPRTTTTEGRHP